MNHLRIKFLLVCVAVLIPVSIFSVQAVRKVYDDIEKEHEDIATRAFDEIERELTLFIEKEEARPFEEYRDVYAPTPNEIVNNSGLVTSPLTELPEESFVTGYFQLAAGGVFESPHSRAQYIEDDAKQKARDATVERLRKISTLLWPKGQRLQPRKKKKNSSPPSTQKSDRQGLGIGGVANLGTRGTAFSVGKKKRSRGSRQTKSQQVSSYNVGPKKTSMSQPTMAETAPVAVSVEPIVGRIVDANSLVLYRTAWSAGDAYRQAVALKIPELGQYFEETLFEAEGLYGPVLRVHPTGRRPGTSKEYNFAHRFEAPFEDISATIELPRLDTEAQPGPVWLLALLAWLASTLGLYALYRSSATILDFGQRRSDFVSAVTHELKTPLTVIRMNAEMLEQGMVETPEKRQEYYRNISRESDRLGRLINNVLELSRIEKGEYRPVLVKGDLQPAIEETIATLRPHAKEHGFTLVTDFPKTVLMAQYDQDAIAQILFNLVDNAIKYGRDADDKEIRLSAQLDHDDVAISFRDFGPGVPQQHLRTIFEPFFRAENELTRKNKGTGIGLALVHELMKRMGGIVSASNPADGGFEVRLVFSGVESA